MNRFQYIGFIMDVPGYWTPCLSGYACLIPGSENIPFSRILGWKTPLTLATLDEKFFAVINVPFLPDFKEWILEREFRDLF